MEELQGLLGFLDVSSDADGRLLLQASSSSVVVRAETLRPVVLLVHVVGKLPNLKLEECNLAIKLITN